MTQQSASPKSILIVEDSEDDYEAIIRAFEKAELTAPVLWCRTGDEAVSFLKNFSKQGAKHSEMPYFVLLDLNMPGMDGREILEFIKEDSSLKPMPVIIFTTSSNERDINRCYQSGANAYMPKPPSFSAMVDVVRSLKNYWLDTALLPTDDVRL